MLSLVSLSSFFVVASAFPPSTGGKLGKSTYAMSDPFHFKRFMENYFPTAENLVRANNTDTCVAWVKLCIDDGHMTSCSGPGGNFQMHAVGAYKRETGAKSMRDLELDFTKAFGAMDKYDPYFEYHYAFYTTGLDTYISDFKSNGIPYFASTFVDPATKKNYYSILVQVPGSLNTATAGTSVAASFPPGTTVSKSILAIELLGDSTTLAAQAGVHQHDLPRASSDGLARAARRLASAPRTHGSNGKPVLASVHLSFASTDLDRDVKYFESVLKGTKVFEGSAAGGRVYIGKVHSADATEMRYMQPSSLATQGPTPVADWERYQVNLHNKCFDPANNQGFDRLADNHVGHAGMGSDYQSFLTAQKASGLPYRFYGGHLYVYAPNGWGMQLGVNPCTGCPESEYNFCTQGIIGQCSKDLPGSSLIV